MVNVNNENRRLTESLAADRAFEAEKSVQKQQRYLLIEHNRNDLHTLHTSAFKIGEMTFSKHIALTHKVITAFAKST